MSSSSVCQGLQSCLEPRVTMEPRVLRLKLDPPSHHKRDSNTGGWSFLQSPSSHCNKPAEDQQQQQQQEEEVYVHPTVKRSSSMLSEKSLEMCTESLGCETGSNASESSDETPLIETVNTRAASSAVPRRRVKRASSYPPPLTSITDFGGVRVRPRREGGRLILEAFPNSHDSLHRPYLHAQRSDGRLRIRLFDSPFLSSDDDDEVEGGVDEEWSPEQEEYDDDDHGDGDGDGDDDECVVENAVEEEMGVNKFGMPRRCKESGNRDIFGVDGYFELPSLSLCL